VSYTALGVLTFLVFLVLKLTSAVSCAWWIVFLPLMIVGALWAVGLVVMGVGLLFAALFVSRR